MKLYIKFFVIILIILVVSALICVVQNKFDLCLNVNDTILLFVGILATFIVIDQRTQVTEIKEETNREILSIKLENKELKSEIEKLRLDVMEKFFNSYNSKNFRERVKFWINVSGDEQKGIVVDKLIDMDEGTNINKEELYRRIENYAMGGLEKRSFILALIDALNIDINDAF